ncbi:hypothetical protein [Saccharothrix sp.]|uniref:hypothetical protein n=1 Tax=Saccharothrix sp. TaxID=1873460 RepID=UPI0028126759|nr:hypothetical protein [Saccharothrix sp.]
MLRWLGVLATAVVVSGCGSGSADLVRGAAEEFLAAASSGDSERACSLLTERARETCSTVDIPGGTVEDIAVWGDAARVRTSSGDTLFLRELSSGWRVSAAGCEPVPERPYSCEVGGP